MNWKRSLLFFVLAVVLPLASCSHAPTCVTNCGGGGNAKLSITMYDTPPTGVDLLSFTLPISAIKLTPSSGSAITLTPAVSSVEATRLQTDSVLIVDAASVSAGTYTLNVTLGATSASSNVFINTSGSGITYTLNGSSFTCANDAACHLPAGTSVTIPAMTGLTLTANQNQWVGLNLNLGNAITTTNGLSVDFSQANVLTARTSPRAGLPSGAMDTVEDFVGSVTAYTSGSSITVKSALSSQSITATLNGSTAYDTPSIPNTNYSGSGCNGSPSASTCLKVGSTVSLDAVLNSDGTLTATEVDVLDAAAADEVEGIIYPTSTANVFALIVADKAVASGSSALAPTSITYGTSFCLDTSTATPYVDLKTLSNQGFSPTPSLNLLAGQQVRAQVTGVASSSTTACPQYKATATNVLLRFSRVTGTASNITSNSFSLTPPSYISTLDTGLAPPLNTQIFPTATAFDGITSLSGLSNGATVSIRALFPNSTAPTFAVAKVRVP